MRPQKVAVALSGGVDSSVCAALLLDKGYQIFGLTMQIGGSGERIKQAQKIARRLHIPHYTVDLRGMFAQKVIQNFCQQYKTGKTPNPCVRCNKYVKFPALYKKAKQLGAEYLATGHYARICFDKKRKRYLLEKGIDRQKDQSYFLYALGQKQLARTMLPLGDLTKSQVRQIAERKGLPSADRAESQEICFIPNNNYAQFLKKHISTGTSAGPIVNTDGKIIGGHKGIINYTIGQRKGLGIAAREPLYVIKIIPRTNTLVVGNKAQVYSKELIADNLNLIYMDSLSRPIKVKAKVRFLHPESRASVIAVGKNKVKVKFDRPQLAVTPGQSVAFYHRDIVLGGGIIKKTLSRLARRHCPD